ncbi:hypothetical protein G9A89_006073 [Geosiphon pyriformis]|nr:hypothetical protein G9A89_006073 [Geosiphon pyriformis]
MNSNFTGNESHQINYNLASKENQSWIFIQESFVCTSPEEPVQHIIPDPNPYIIVPFPPEINPLDLIKANENGDLRSRCINKFLIYRNEYAKQLQTFGYKISMRKVSRMAAIAWKEEPDYVIRHYEKIAHEVERLHISLSLVNFENIKDDHVEEGNTFGLNVHENHSALTNDQTLSKHPISSVPTSSVKDQMGFNSQSIHISCTSQNPATDHAIMDKTLWSSEETRDYFNQQNFPYNLTIDIQQLHHFPLNFFTVPSMAASSTFDTSK